MRERKPLYVADMSAETADPRVAVAKEYLVGSAAFVRSHGDHTPPRSPPRPVPRCPQCPVPTADFSIDGTPFTLSQASNGADDLSAALYHGLVTRAALPRLREAAAARREGSGDGRALSAAEVLGEIEP